LSAMISKSTTTTKGRRCSEGYLLCRLVALVSGLAALGPAAARAGEHDAEVVTTFRKGVLVMPYIGFAVPVGKVSDFLSTGWHLGGLVGDTSTLSCH